MRYDLLIRTDDTATPVVGHDAFDPPPSPVWAETTEGPWRIALRFSARNGSPVLSEVRFYPTEDDARAGQWSGDEEHVPEGGLRPSILRFPLGEVRDAALQRLLDPSHAYWDDGWPIPGENWFDAAGQAGINAGADAESHGRPGRAPLSDQQLASVSLFYVEALALGEKVLVHVDTRLAARGEYISRAAIASRIDKARKRGFLTKAPTGGQKGGTLTIRSKRVLHEMGHSMEDEET